MADQIVITEKSSQAKDVRAAVGSRYGDILAAQFASPTRRLLAPRVVCCGAGTHCLRVSYRADADAVVCSLAITA